MRTTNVLALGLIVLLAGCAVPREINKNVGRDWTLRFEGYNDTEIRDMLQRFKDEFNVRARTDAFKNEQVVIRWNENDMELEEKVRKFLIQTGFPSATVSADRATTTLTVRRAEGGQ